MEPQKKKSGTKTHRKQRKRDETVQYPSILLGSGGHTMVPLEEDREVGSS